MFRLSFLLTDVDDKEEIEGEKRNICRIILLFEKVYYYLFFFQPIISLHRRHLCVDFSLEEFRLTEQTSDYRPTHKRYDQWMTMSYLRKQILNLLFTMCNRRTDSVAGWYLLWLKANLLLEVHWVFYRYKPKNIRFLGFFNYILNSLAT